MRKKKTHPHPSILIQSLEEEQGFFSECLKMGRLRESPVDVPKSSDRED